MPVPWPTILPFEVRDAEVTNGISAVREHWKMKNGEVDNQRLHRL